MRTVTSIVLALAVAGSASTAIAQDPAHDEPAERTEPTPTILHADEGEKLLMSGDRHVILKATAEGMGARELLLGSETLPPGSAIPVHSHDGYEEIIFIHEGTVRLTLGDRVAEAEPGTTMFVPPGTWHGVEAYGDAEATMVFIFPETDIAEFFRAVGYEEGDTPPELTPGDWARIMEQHQMRSRD